MSELPYANRPLRVGVQLQPQHADYADLRRVVAAAEEDGSSGFDLALTRDWLQFRDEQNADLSERGRPIAQLRSDKVA